jgi:hypothetical protein
LNPQPLGLRERTWLPGTHRQAMQAALAVAAVVVGTSALIYGAVGAAIGNEEMERYATTNMEAMWKLWALIFLFYYAGPARVLQVVKDWARERWADIKKGGR